MNLHIHIAACVHFCLPCKYVSKFCRHFYTFFSFPHTFLFSISGLPLSHFLTFSFIKSLISPTFVPLIFPLSCSSSNPSISPHLSIILFLSRDWFSARHDISFLGLTASRKTSLISLSLEFYLNVPASRLSLYTYQLNFIHLYQSNDICYMLLLCISNCATYSVFVLDGVHTRFLAPHKFLAKTFGGRQS